MTTEAGGASTGPSAGPTPREIAESLLAVPDHRDRTRRLREIVPVHGSEALVEELRRSAEHAVRRDPREAGRIARLGQLVAEAIMHPRGRIGCLVARAKADLVCADAGLALDSIDEAARLARQIEDEPLEIDIDLLRVQCLTALERYDDAGVCGRRTMAACDRRGDRRNRVLARMALADVAYRSDRPREALGYYSEVDRLLPADASQQVRGALAMNRANSLEACNRFRAAARHFDRARESFVEAGCGHTAAQVDYNAAYGDFLRGRYDEALRRYAACEEVFKKLDDGRHLAHIDLDRAEIHLHLGLPDEASGFAAAAEARFLTLGLAKERAHAVFVHARAAEMRGDGNTALVWFERAELLFKELALTERALSCVVARAGVLERQGQTTSARNLARVARGMSDERMNPLSRATVDLLVARLDLGRGAPAAAISRAEEVLDACRRIHAPLLHVEALRLVAGARAARGEMTEAVAAYKRAVDRLEAFRGGVPPDEYMASFLGGRSALYEEIVEALVRAGEAPSAFEYAERGKARSLTDSMTARRGRGADKGGADPATARVRYLRERLDAVYEQLARREGEREARDLHFAEAARGRAESLEREIEALLRRRRIDAPASSSATAVDAPGLAALRASLDADVAVVEYVVAAEAVIAFAVTRDDVHVVRRSIRREDLARLVERCRYHLKRGRDAGPEKDDPILATARIELAGLTELLFEPLAPRLCHVRRLVVVPHGELHHVPFHAFTRGGGWLSDVHEIVYAPSAAVYALCRGARPSADGDPAVFGIPDASAPHIETECRRVADAIGPSRLHLRDEATFDRLRDAAGTARIVHVATHGMFRRGRPMLSSIRLADRWIDARDLGGLSVAGELVVLSACESGASEADGANEILGLTRGLLSAGAPAVLSSRWTVDDSAAGALMERFHRSLRDGEGAATAHRRAMEAVRADRPHPFYWAPFFLTGCPVDARRPTKHEAPQEVRT